MKKEINNLQKIKLSLFAPIDEDYPIIEVLYDDEVIIDFTIDPSDHSSVKILFHQASSGISIHVNIFQQIMDEAKNKLLKAL